MKALAALTEEKTITVKLFGKVKIYLADQAKFKIPDEASLVALDNGGPIDLRGLVYRKARSSF
jgi:hypothetical protein